MAILEDFFIPTKYIDNISEEEYDGAKSLICLLDAIARTTYQSLYIIDCFRNDFLYVSQNQLLLCGHTAEEIKEMGFMFYIKHVPKEEQNMLVELNKRGFTFYERLPIEERMNYSISCDFNITSNKKKTLINHKLTPIALSKNNQIWLAICIVSLSAHESPGHIEIRKQGQTSFWEYSLDYHKWIENQGIVLTEKEKDILSLSARGYTMNDIADNLCVAIDTVKFYKRRLFQKLNVKNITEAISFATNYKLL